jgi:hypothetical protein
MKELYFDRENTNTMEASPTQKRQKKICKEVEKENYYSSSHYVNEVGKIRKRRGIKRCQN